LQRGTDGTVRIAVVSKCTLIAPPFSRANASSSHHIPAAHSAHTCALPGPDVMSTSGSIQMSVEDQAVLSGCPRCRRGGAADHHGRAVERRLPAVARFLQEGRGLPARCDRVRCGLAPAMAGDRGIERSSGPCRRRKGWDILHQRGGGRSVRFGLGGRPQAEHSGCGGLRFDLVDVANWTPRPSRNLPESTPDTLTSVLAW
jgi:hypothetical protein